MSAKKKPLPANAGANTLFNYFSKSPAATSNKRALTDSPGTPISAKKPKPGKLLFYPLCFNTVNLGIMSMFYVNLRPRCKER